VSCHSVDEVRRAKKEGVDFVLFGPVFEKRVDGEMVGDGVGLERLQEACSAAAGMPVLALGGVTWPRAELCIEAGAAGVAGIRLFG
jgi:thiamine-phosphate pyrophosphorylase